MRLHWLAAATLVGMDIATGRREAAGRGNDPRSDAVKRCYFGSPNRLPGGPPKPLTKRQRRRMRGKTKRR